MPLSKVVKTVDDIRSHRYSMLRRIFRRDDARLIDDDHSLREELRSFALPPRAHGIGKKIADLRLKDIDISITAIRRDGIVGREPGPETILRSGDVIVLCGTPEPLDRGEARLLTG